MNYSELDLQEFRGKMILSTQKLFDQFRKGIITVDEIEVRLIELLATR